MNRRPDLVIRNGVMIDGSGGDGIQADIAISGETIAAIGGEIAPGFEEIDAKGCVVTPGFVAAHMHYDGQVTWENSLVPSSAHGVTTAIIGSCGVGFALCGIARGSGQPARRPPHAACGMRVEWESDCIFTTKYEEVFHLPLEEPRRALGVRRAVEVDRKAVSAIWSEQG